MNINIKQGLNGHNVFFTVRAVKYDHILKKKIQKQRTEMSVMLHCSDPDLLINSEQLQLVLVYTQQHNGLTNMHT